MQKEVDALQRYVTEHQIAIRNFYKITQWVDRDKITAISLYYEDRLIYDSNISYRAGTLTSGIKRKPLPWEKLYPIKFQNDVVQMSLTVYLKHHDYDMALLRNLTIFFLLFTSMVLFFVQRKTTAIFYLEQQVQLMQGGKLDLPIEAKGNDEISSLAESLDEMRHVFIKQIQEEKEMGIESKRFASTMAHDIRTPLAALIGYLDILIHNRTNDEKKRHQYLIKSGEKAEQLRILTDHLFGHFVMPRPGSLTRQENCIDHAALESMVFDSIFLLESEGFKVKAALTWPASYRIHIHREPLQRILDNLISNILKYADQAVPLSITTRIEHASLIISVLNGVKAHKGNAASTGLGINACKRLLEECGGRLCVTESKENYRVDLKIPLD